MAHRSDVLVPRFTPYITTPCCCAVGHCLRLQGGRRGAAAVGVRQVRGHRAARHLRRARLRQLAVPAVPGGAFLSSMWHVLARQNRGSAPSTHACTAAAGMRCQMSVFAYFNSVHHHLLSSSDTFHLSHSQPCSHVAVLVQTLKPYILNAGQVGGAAGAVSRRRAAQQVAHDRRAPPRRAAQVTRPFGSISCDAVESPFWRCLLVSAHAFATIIVLIHEAYLPNCGACNTATLIGNAVRQRCCRAAIRQHLDADPSSQRSLAPKPALARRYMIGAPQQQQVRCWTVRESQCGSPSPCGILLASRNTAGWAHSTTRRCGALSQLYEACESADVPAECHGGACCRVGGHVLCRRHRRACGRRSTSLCLGCDMVYMLCRWLWA
jgi:hypothetical protein